MTWPPTIPIEGAQEGDLVFCHSAGLVGRAIRMAERVRWRSGSGWNHVAWLDHHDGEDWVVGQAEGRGVTVGAHLEDVAPGGNYVVVTPPLGTNRVTELEFLRAQVGTPYGFLTIASIVITLLSPRFLNVMLPNTWICSAVAAEGLRAGGWVHNWPDLYQTSPAQLWLAIT